MQLYKTLKEGVDVLKCKSTSIRQISRDKDLEEVFLVNLFLNYIIVLVFFFFMIGSGVKNVFGGINDQSLFALLLIYPFIYNLVIYLIFGLFGILAEFLNRKKKVKPMLSVGYHVGVVYAVLVYIIALIGVINPVYSFYLSIILFIYFLYMMLVSMKSVYKLSGNETAITILLFLFILSLIGLIGVMIEPIATPLLKTLLY